MDQSGQEFVEKGGLLPEREWRSNRAMNERVSDSGTAQGKKEGAKNASFSLSEEGRHFNALLLAVGRERSRAAFAEIFAYFAPRLKYTFCRSGTDPGVAEELVQEVMLMIWRRAELFDPTRASASTWIFAIARNRRIDRARREQHPELDPEDPALAPVPEEQADLRLEHAQENARLRQALQGLPPEQADLLRRAYFEDKSHSLIAMECKLPLGTVKSRLRLALDRLRRALAVPDA